MKVLVIGGGTFQPISNHLSLGAPAFGSTAKTIHRMLTEQGHESTLVLTRMANPESVIFTNTDVKALLENAVSREDYDIIICNVAFTDFEYPGGDFHADRLSSDAPVNLKLVPSEKVIDLVRKHRPEIFLVGFKTTTRATPEEQFLKGLRMMKRSKCNLVLANDTVTRNNIIITPEETYYPTENREDALSQLVEMMISRAAGNFTRSIFKPGRDHNIDLAPSTFQQVVKFLVERGSFIENNGNGFTPGHFCWKVSENSFLSSQRKANHNKVFENGMSLVGVNDDESFTVYGSRKASVGARSQWMILQAHPGYDCIVHTHSPLKPGSKVPITPQKPYQCGSLECGLNTLNHMADFDGIRAVYLEKHGPNVLFKSTDDPQRIIDFLEANFQLDIKTT